MDSDSLRTLLILFGGLTLLFGLNTIGPLKSWYEGNVLFLCFVCMGFSFVAFIITLVMMIFTAFGVLPGIGVILVLLAVPILIWLRSRKQRCKRCNKQV